MLNSVQILGVRVNCIGKSELLTLVEEWVCGNTPRTITYVNAHCLNKSCVDSSYRSILNSCDLIYADGIGVVWASRQLGGCRAEKVTGRDWIERFCQMAATNGWRIYILAGKPGVAENARLHLSDIYTGLRIVGVADGYFQTKGETEVLQEIADTRSQILLVGMGVGVQEKWIARHRTAIPTPVCWSVGALFDYISGIEPPVPAWMNDFALEWLWRLLVDPAGKWKRYLLGNPLFLGRILRQKYLSVR